jgi:hypothetical protein
MCLIYTLTHRNNTNTLLSFTIGSTKHKQRQQKLHYLETMTGR